MKIVASISRDKWLLEANDYEIGRIMGDYSASDKKLDVGFDIPVSELYEATRQIVNSQKELSERAEKLGKLISALQTFGATLGPIAQRIKEKELKEAK